MKSSLDSVILKLFILYTPNPQVRMYWSSSLPEVKLKCSSMKNLAIFCHRQFPDEYLKSYLAASVDASLSISSSAASGRVSRGNEVQISCTVDRTISPLANIVWLRRTGDLYNVIANDNYLLTYVRGYDRYSFSQNDDSTITLHVTGVQYEDSGTFACQLSYQGMGQLVSVPLVVCKYTDSDSCKCQQRKGWADPSCFEEPKDAQTIIGEYRGGVIGLVICLVIAIIYGVVVTVYLYRDVIKRLRLRAQKKLERQKQRADEETRTLNLSDNLSTISGSQMGHVANHSTNHVRARGENRERDYQTTAPLTRDDQSDHEYRSLDGEYGDTRYEDSSHTKHQGAYGQENPGFSQYETEPEGRSHYNTHNAPVYFRPPANEIQNGGQRSPMYRNPPSSADRGYSAHNAMNSDPTTPRGASQNPGANAQHGRHYRPGEPQGPNSHEQQTRGPDSVNYSGARPNNSPPGRSAFSPVQREPATPDGSRKMSSVAASSKQSTHQGHTPQQPPQYATLVANFHQALSGTPRQNPPPYEGVHGPPPESTRSERVHPNAAIVHTERGAYTDQKAPRGKQLGENNNERHPMSRQPGEIHTERHPMSRQPGENHTEGHPMNRQPGEIQNERPPMNSQQQHMSQVGENPVQQSYAHHKPQRLEFGGEVEGNVPNGQGPYVSQHDTVI